MNQQFIRKVADLFLENGAKTLTMDDIAKKFGISKKTLYQKYTNKEALLEDVVHFKLGEISEKIESLTSTVDNAIDSLLCRDDEMERAVQANNSLFIRQLVKYYPAIFHEHMMSFSERFSEMMLANIKKGRSQGLYREDFDAEIYTRLFFLMMMSYDGSPFLESTSISREKYKISAMQMFLNAICSEEGKEYLKKYNNKYEQTV